MYKKEDIKHLVDFENTIRDIRADLIGTPNAIKFIINHEDTVISSNAKRTIERAYAIIRSQINLTNKELKSK